ncbi:MAG: MFS transporter [Thermoplasmata archaeon]|nr:MFS transporter [Thermoplasmata archaeon]
MFTKKQRYLLVSSSGGFFLWGIVSAIAPLSVYWPISSGYMTILLIIGPIFLVTGNFIMGVLSDFLGRKKIFIITLILYTIGIIFISLANSALYLAIGLAISQFAVGGEEPPALALLSENFDYKERSITLTLIPNFMNIGSAVASVFFLTSFLVNEQEQRIALLLLSLILIGILMYTRLNIPESYLWLKDKGIDKKAKEELKDLYISNEGRKIPPPKIRLVLPILIMLGISQYMSFWLMAIAIGPYIFPEQTNIIIFTATIGASLGAFLALPIIKIGKKKYTLISFAGGSLTIFLLLILEKITNFWIFLLILFVNMIFSEFAWISRTNLEPELFKTLRRTTLISIVRIFPISLYIFALIYTVNFSVSEFITLNFILWLIGLIASIIWYKFGIETYDISIDYIK